MVDCPSQFCSHGVLSPVKDGKAYYCTQCGFVASQVKFDALAAVQAAPDPVLAASAPKVDVPRGTVKKAVPAPKKAPVPKKKAPAKKSFFSKGGKK